MSKAAPTPSSFDATYYAQQSAPTAAAGVNGVISTASLNNNTWGMPSSKEPTTNHPFDNRIRRVSVNGKGSTSEGLLAGISTASGRMSAVGPDGRTYMCYFEFNPTEIDISYGFDSTVAAVLNPSFDFAGAASTSSQGLMLNASVSFTLLFDRTYEVWTGKKIKTAQGRPALQAAATAAAQHAAQVGGAQANNAAKAAQSALANSMGPYKFGVMWDVWAIERLVGIFGQYNGAPPSGPPAANITQVRFGPDSTGGAVLSPKTSLGGGYAFGFAGWMTAFEVQYTRFDASMVPTRCAVGLTFEQIYSLQALSTNIPTVQASGQ